MTYDVFHWVGEDADGWELYAEKCGAREAIGFIRNLESQGYDRDATIFVERRESEKKVQRSLV
jgi:hypothetical protein